MLVPMSDTTSPVELGLNGRVEALEAGATLRGLGRDEGLVRISALRRDMKKRRLLLYTQGSSSQEVQAWHEEYHAALSEHLKEWLAAVQP
jgi:hypothetical protein